ncbi:MAG TPA: M20/M25/M40 family metallo-hydrolase, partial [Candidatus Dormibacteraeota bacterium]|nr:M20/M25/M40 family metallo-hydrolase [Candidatus Dormibacteraeota bacterium]
GGGHAAYRQNASAIDSLIEAISILRSACELPLAPAPDGVVAPDQARTVTVNVGRINGGTSPNLLATAATADVDIRFPLGLTALPVLDTIRAELRRLHVACDLSVISMQDATETNPSDPYIKVLQGVASTMLQRKVESVVRVGGSDARLFRRAGLPTAVYGLTPHNMGAADEFIELAELSSLTDIYAATLETVFTNRTSA